MVESIEAFVEKIRSEGVDAGRRQGEEALAEAHRQADELRSEAEREREKILSDARAEAEGILSRSQTELELAARDAAMRLRDALSRALRAVLAGAVNDKIVDAGFVGTVLHEIITQYAAADIEGKGEFRINVPTEMRQKLIDWAVSEIGQETITGSHVPIDLQGALKQAGFEYNATGATVEVTEESVVAVLAELVGPRLREIIDQAMAGKDAEDRSPDGT